MNARQRRKLRRYWSRAFGRPLSDEDARQCEQLADWIRHVNRVGVMLERNDRAGGLRTCPCVVNGWPYDECEACDGTGEVWVHHHEWCLWERWGCEPRDPTLQVVAEMCGWLGLPDTTDDFPF